MIKAQEWELSRRTLSLERPQIMGILNVTPDSFSDGGRFFSLEAAVERACELERAGADIIDIGGESTRPNAPAVTLQEELDRVLPVIEALKGRITAPISIDTYKAGVAEAACAAGAEIVNDVTGLMFDPEMAAVVAAADAGVVVMHTRGMPDTMQKDTGYDDLIADVRAYLEESIALARKAGVPEARIVIDPGLGFGKSVQGNLELIKRLEEFLPLGRPILVGPSRKSFIGAVTGRDGVERVFGTAAAVAMSIVHGATIVRVHDVAAMRDVALMTRALM
ncbi:dihydropteroate synthase [Geomonas sp. Red69]|uniref:Dihydropteroate synthase n=1 Tax=Geomonas diazotrophica TaxID=2843197 RepID=A0ABX8JPH5_9BACT|nr:MULTISPECIES: dihydropteroate synthase [Geomonas]MBU5636501.1 dihydropteroate synthase [Geomonas diazotrophica]QWV98996.1 dihydropteroate synthase [Geomonas nitrogeniifigens]QXE88162.1 dihydropteroate synthase [Geomonas nitrogeniifigens]